MNIIAIKKLEAEGVMMSEEYWSRISGKAKRKIKARLMQEHNGKPVCHSCGSYVHDDRDLTIDHIVPLSRGGKILDLNNMQLLCRKKCHSRKNAIEVNEQYFRSIGL